MTHLMLASATVSLDLLEPIYCLKGCAFVLLGAVASLSLFPLPSNQSFPLSLLPSNPSYPLSLSLLPFIPSFLSPSFLHPTLYSHSKAYWKTAHFNKELCTLHVSDQWDMVLHGQPSRLVTVGDDGSQTMQPQGEVDH